jgi:hypothetical protein
MYSSLTLLQDVLFSKLHYPYLYYGLHYKSSEFGNVMLSLLDRVESFEKIITYMLLLQADYTTDIDFHNVDLVDDIKKMLYKNISKNLHHIIFYELSFKIKTLTYQKHKNSKLILLTSSSLVIPIQNVKLANLFANVALINSYVKKFSATILSYITLLM